jgi:LmbE family N-acetylglucosaminyl deacetylase
MDRELEGLPKEEQAARLSAIKRKHRKRRIIVYGSLIAVAWSFWAWQPWEFDLLERKPSDVSKVDPDSKRLFAPGTKVLVVTAHPDDSEFYIGGTLHLLGKTAVIDQVICTDGDKGYYGFFTNAAENRRVRRAEAQQALDAWGGRELTLLGHPDGRLRVTDELVDQIAAKVRNFRPDYVLAFDGDFPPRLSHQDHRRAGDAAQLAVLKAGVPLWLCRFSTVGANFYVDITDVWDRKEQLLAVHKSQFNGDRLRRVSNMVAGNAEKDGEAIDVGLAEGYRCERVFAVR